MKRHIIRYGTIILLMGALTATQAHAQGGESCNQIQLESFSWGIVPGQAARVSVAQFLFADGSVRTRAPIIARIQLLDTEGDVIAESHEMRVEPGKIRFWDVSRDQIRAVGEPGTGRIQVRARIRARTKQSGANRSRPPFAPTLELFDPGTGSTAALITVEWLFVDEIGDPPPV